MGIGAAFTFGFGALDTYGNAQEARGRNEAWTTDILQFVGDQPDIVAYSTLPVKRAIGTTDLMSGPSPSDLPEISVSELTRSTDMQLMLMLGSFALTVGSVSALRK